MLLLFGNYRAYILLVGFMSFVGCSGCIQLYRRMAFLYVYLTLSSMHLLSWKSVQMSNFPGAHEKLRITCSASWFLFTRIVSFRSVRDSLGFVMILSVNVGRILRKFVNFRSKKRFTDLCVVCTYYATVYHIYLEVSWISKVPPKN